MLWNLKLLEKNHILSQTKGWRGDVGGVNAAAALFCSRRAARTRGSELLSSLSPCA